MMQGFKGTVQFPTLPEKYQLRSFRYFESENMTSAVRKATTMAYRENEIRSRRPKQIIVILEVVRKMEG